MPPEPLEYQGRDAVGGFLLDRAHARAPAGLRLIPTRANGQPAFGLYIEDRHAAFYRCFGLLVLTLEGERISAITRFRDSAVLALFGMPRTLQR